MNPQNIVSHGSGEILLKMKAGAVGNLSKMVHVTDNLNREIIHGVIERRSLERLMNVQL